MASKPNVEIEDQSEVDPNELAFIFKNVQCTIPANLALCKWILWMTEAHPESLKFLFKQAQEYVDHGGGSVYSFARWSGKIKKDCLKQYKELTK
jgi:hypothetical protein